MVFRLLDFWDEIAMNWMVFDFVIVLGTLTKPGAVNFHLFDENLELER